MNNLAGIIKQRRIAVRLTIRELAVISGVSASHLARIERGQRFPSAHTLRKIARPLSINEGELFALAGFLSTPDGIDETMGGMLPGLDPDVAKILAEEAFAVQRAAVGVLNILKGLAQQVEK